MSNDSTLSDHSKHVDQLVCNSETVTSSHEEEPTSSYTMTHVQHSGEQSPTMNYSSDDESSSILSGVFADNEIDPPSSTVQPHTNDIAEGTANYITHKSTGSNSSVISDSCVSDSEYERSSVDADGQPCYGDRVVMPLNNTVSHNQANQQKMHVSIASNLTTVTPTELSSLSDDESDENQSSSGEDSGEQDEVEMAGNSESSERSGTSQTLIVTQSLLNKDDNTKEQQHHSVANSLKDITNSLSQPPPTTLHQEDEQASFTLPPSHSPIQKFPPKR